MRIVKSLSRLHNEARGFNGNRRGDGNIHRAGYRGCIKLTFVVESGVNNVGDKVYENLRQRHLSPTGYEIGICRSEFRLGRLGKKLKADTTGRRMKF